MTYGSFLVTSYTLMYSFWKHANSWLLTWYRNGGVWSSQNLKCYCSSLPCWQVCVQRAGELRAMGAVICQNAPISKSNISTIIAGQFGCCCPILNLLNSSTFKKAQGRKTQVGWDWEEILLGGHNIQSRHTIFSQGTQYLVKAHNI